MSLSIIIPANNEAGYIDTCLSALIASGGPGTAQIVVVANGCTDDTVERAQAFADPCTARGWSLEVLDLPGLGKHGALNAGDAVASYPARAYLDADVVVSPPLMDQVDSALQSPDPRYVSGTPRVTARSALSRAYARFWVRLPFVSQGVPGFGLYAVNATGRARWGAFPAIISDDTFVRCHFTPEERFKIPATYDWPIVEGLQPLIRVRRRQDKGVEELDTLYPGLLENEGKARIGKGWLLRQSLQDPLGFAVYAIASLAVRLGGKDQDGWVRGR